MRNVRGDGKFHQSSFPADVKLMVGRVDLANMPGRLVCAGPATFPSAQELLRRYLNKDHNVRNKQFTGPRLPLVVNFFFFSSRRRHTRLQGDWSSDVCSSD